MRIMEKLKYLILMPIKATANIMEYKVGNNTNIADFVIL